MAWAFLEGTVTEQCTDPARADLRGAYARRERQLTKLESDERRFEDGDRQRPVANFDPEATRRAYLQAVHLKSLLLSVKRIGRHEGVLDAYFALFDDLAQTLPNPALMQRYRLSRASLDRLLKETSRPLLEAVPRCAPALVRETSQYHARLAELAKQRSGAGVAKAVASVAGALLGGRVGSRGGQILVEKLFDIKTGERDARFRLGVAFRRFGTDYLGAVEEVSLRRKLLLSAALGGALRRVSIDLAVFGLRITGITKEGVLTVGPSAPRAQQATTVALASVREAIRLGNVGQNFEALRCIDVGLDWLCRIPQPMSLVDEEGVPWPVVLARHGLFVLDAADKKALAVGDIVECLRLRATAIAFVVRMPQAAPLDFDRHMWRLFSTLLGDESNSPKAIGEAASALTRIDVDKLPRECRPGFSNSVRCLMTYLQDVHAESWPLAWASSDARVERRLLQRHREDTVAGCDWIRWLADRVSAHEQRLASARSRAKWLRRGLLGLWAAVLTCGAIYIATTDFRSPAERCADLVRSAQATPSMQALELLRLAPCKVPPAIALKTLLRDGASQVDPQVFERWAVALNQPDEKRAIWAHILSRRASGVAFKTTTPVQNIFDKLDLADKARTLVAAISSVDGDAPDAAVQSLGRDLVCLGHAGAFALHKVLMAAVRAPPAPGKVFDVAWSHWPRIADSSQLVELAGAAFDGSNTAAMATIEGKYRHVARRTTSDDLGKWVALGSRCGTPRCLLFVARVLATCGRKGGSGAVLELLDRNTDSTTDAAIAELAAFAADRSEVRAVRRLLRKQPRATRQALRKTQADVFLRVGRRPWRGIAAALSQLRKELVPGREHRQRKIALLILLSASSQDAPSIAEALSLPFLDVGAQVLLARSLARSGGQARPAGSLDALAPAAASELKPPLGCETDGRPVLPSEASSGASR